MYIRKGEKKHLPYKSKQQLCDKGARLSDTGSRQVKLLRVPFDKSDVIHDSSCSPNDIKHGWCAMGSGR